MNNRLSISKIIVYLFNILLYIQIYTRGYESNPDVMNIFLFAFMSNYLIIIYLLSRRASDLNQRYSTLHLIFYMFSLYVGYKLVSLDTTNSSLVLLVLIHSFFDRILIRIKSGGFPLLTVILNIAVIFSINNPELLNYFPIVYIVLQKIEDYFELKYVRVLDTMSTSFSASIFVFILFSFLVIRGWQMIFVAIAFSLIYFAYEFRYLRSKDKYV